MIKILLLKVLFVASVAAPLRPAEVVIFGIWVLFVSFLKCFIGLASDRCQALLSSPNATFWQHARCGVLILCILTNDLAWMAAGLGIAQELGFNSSLFWMVDEACVAVEAVQVALRYVIHGISVYIRRKQSSRCHEEGQDVGLGDAHAEEELRQRLYILDLSTDTVISILGVTHLAMILRLRGRPQFQAVDLALLLNLRFAVVGLWYRARKHLRFRTLTRRLNSGFADADIEQLVASQATCTICMDSMKACFYIYFSSASRDAFVCVRRDAT